HRRVGAGGGRGHRGRGRHDHRRAFGPQGGGLPSRLPGGRVSVAGRKLVLAYSGGLDTSVAIRWLRDQGHEVVALTVDLGGKKELGAIQERALRVGASTAYVVDGKVPFIRDFIWPSLQAGAVYEKEYPLATALGRPLIAAILVQIARREGAQGIAHGCTGKGNEQVRFDANPAAQ